MNGDAADSADTNWTDREIDLAVADYFDMLTRELAGQPYVKSHRNAALRQLIDRSTGSIEYKHQNISAVLQVLGRPWILGYKPMPNYQGALLAGIERHLTRSLDDPVVDVSLSRPLVHEEKTVFLESPPPVLRTEETLPSQLNRLIRKFDPAARDERNRALGKRGEEVALEHERATLIRMERHELANKVRWVSQEDGDGAGYDILSFDASGSERLIEVKTTTGDQRTPFYVSENERLVSLERPDSFRIFRLYDFARMPRAFEIVPPLHEAMILSATAYRASFD